MVPPRSGPACHNWANSIPKAGLYDLVGTSIRTIRIGVMCVCQTRHPPQKNFETFEKNDTPECPVGSWAVPETDPTPPAAGSAARLARRAPCASTARVRPVHRLCDEAGSGLLVASCVTRSAPSSKASEPLPR